MNCAQPRLRSQAFRFGIQPGALSSKGRRGGPVGSLGDSEMTDMTKTNLVTFLLGALGMIADLGEGYEVELAVKMKVENGVLLATMSGGEGGTFARSFGTRDEEGEPKWVDAELLLTGDAPVEWFYD